MSQEIYCRLPKTQWQWTLHQVTKCSEISRVVQDSTKVYVLNISEDPEINHPEEHVTRETVLLQQEGLPLSVLSCMPSPTPISNARAPVSHESSYPLSMHYTGW